MKAWEDFLENQKKILGEATVIKWLYPLKIIKFDACNLYLEANDYFQKTWFEEHIRPALKDFKNNNDNFINIHINVKNETIEKKQPIEKRYGFEITSDTLDPTMIFATFFPSKKNEISFNFLKNQAIEQTNIESCNPIFIYGETDCGKTHLLISFANTCIEKKLKVMFVKAETFTSHVVNAIRMNMMDKFRQIYRSCDVLIIDDIHMLANKNATQEELFHTFNALHTQKKQIVLSANVKPRQIENMEDRLISRFEWGIPLKIQKLEKLEIKSLITMKNDFFHLNLTNSAIDFLFTTFNTNISGLQKALKALILRLHMNNTPHNEVKIEDIKHNLQDLLDIEKKEVITFDKIINTCASYFKLTSEDILGKSQTKQHTHPRQMAMYLCRQYLNLSYPKIGQLFKRDHSTVITSVKAIQKEMEEKSNNKTISSILEIRKTL